MFVQARCDWEEMILERWEGLRKRVKERWHVGGDEEAETGAGRILPREAEGREATVSASVSGVEEDVVGSAPEVYGDEDGGVNSSSNAVSRYRASSVFRPLLVLDEYEAPYQ